MLAFKIVQRGFQAMNKPIKQSIPLPYLFIAMTMAPIFFIAFLFPAKATSTPFVNIESFINTNLLGVAGFWSSNFPFSSIVITNYIGLLGPIFAVIFFLKVRKGMIIDAEQYANMTVSKYLFGLIVLSSFIYMIVSVSYFYPHDLAAHNLKWRLFGTNIFTYAIFSSGVLFIIYFITLILYFSFLYIPNILINRYKQR